MSPDELIEGIKVPDYPRLIRAGLTEAQKRNHVRALNLLRRHLSPDQLKEHMTAMRQDGMTYQEIAEAAGVSVFIAYQKAHDKLLENKKMKRSIMMLSILSPSRWTS